MIIAATNQDLHARVRQGQLAVLAHVHDRSGSTDRARIADRTGAVKRTAKFQEPGWWRDP